MMQNEVYKYVKFHKKKKLFSIIYLRTNKLKQQDTVLYKSINM